MNLSTISNELRWSPIDTLHMTWRNVLRYRRSPDLLVFSTIQPVMFVLLFVYVFGGAINSGGLEYVDYLLPGILVQTTLFGATQTGVGLAEDLQKGMIDRYKSLPMARSAVVAGRIAADIIRNSFVVALMIGVGLAVGFRFHGGVAGFALPAVIIMFGLGFSWIMAVVGVSVKSTEAAQVFSFMSIFPLTFMSSTFVPIETMPGWLQPIAEYNPVTSAVNTARALAQGGEVWHWLWRTVAWTTGILMVFIPLAVLRYRKI